MHPSNLVPGLASPEDLERVIQRVVTIYEEELGENLGAWGAVSMVLVTIVCDMTGADINEVAEVLKSRKGTMQCQSH
jgi:hypothetical protein